MTGAGPDVRVEPCAKRVRVVVDGRTVADTRRALLLFETGRLPVYYFPRADLRDGFLAASAARSHCPRKGEALYWTFVCGARRVDDLVWAYPQPLPGCPPIGDYAAFAWEKADHWLEEDEEVFVHPRDPHHRVDCLFSRRAVRVALGDATLAHSERAIFLFETGWPTRHYLPLADVDATRLSPSARVSRCPYKGVAAYFDVAADGRCVEGRVWTYRAPIADVARIAGLVCFPAEHFDIFVEGEREAATAAPRW